MLSILDLFRIGIGPSSSHTVGPMRIAHRFINRARRNDLLARTKTISVFLRGSLAFTGKGHATDRAVMLGLLGYEPETLEIEKSDCELSAISATRALQIQDGPKIDFDPDKNILFDYETPADLHPNAMVLVAYDEQGQELLSGEYYSTGGGFVASRAQLLKDAPDDVVSLKDEAPLPFHSGAQLLGICDANGLSIEEVVRTNEEARLSREEFDRGLDHIAEIMMACIDRGLRNRGELPGSLRVQRRAPMIWEKLQSRGPANERETLFDWLNVYAMAVNEENAAGGQVVTAPTNGAAGIIPSVIRHYCTDREDKTDMVRRFLITAGGIGLLYKQRASISGAEMGCQGEVGVACSMAAAGLAAVWGGSPQQISCAAEIGMEHNLGLTCDPVAGLVQIPCIERNAIGAVKAANAARLALHGTGHARVSLDQVIETMRQTGLDMSSKYKETSQGGLAVNVVEC